MPVSFLPAAPERRHVSAADSVSALMFETAARYPDHELFAIPGWLREKWGAAQSAWTYAEIAGRVRALAAAYRAAGYGAGHRVAVLLENRPLHFIHWLALNSFGAAIVPINPDYKEDELRYALEHSESVLVVTLPGRQHQVAAVAAALGIPVLLEADPPAGATALPRAVRAAPGGPAGLAAVAALLYTSGTTGRPKGCLQSNDFFLGWGQFYAAQGGVICLREGQERLLQPLPTFHTNAMGNSFMGMITVGGTQIILDRFHPRSWWQDAIETRATLFHFLGVMPAMLLSLPPSPLDKAHAMRFGFGGGIHPSQQAAFEERFGAYLLEGWAMTETGGACLLTAAYEPRHVGTRCIGHPDRPGPAMEIRIVDDERRDVPRGTAGDFLVRARGPDPRRQMSSGYLKDQAATDAAWRDGWFNTGDIVRQDEDGNLYFVDRKKSIIRRSGENIASAEVEGTLAAHPGVKEVAVLAVLDEIRGEEVMAVIVPQAGHAPDAALAAALFEHCRARFAYYKAPGYIAFMAELPTTSTQKIRRADLGDLAENPTRHANCFDLRARKQQSRPTAQAPAGPAPGTP